MLNVINQYTNGDLKITEYSRDGVNVHATVKEPIQMDESIEPQEPINPKPTLDEIAEETLLETKYQTLLLEMML